MTPRTKSYSAAAVTARNARSLLIELTHQMPASPPKALCEKWVAVDEAVKELAEMLEEAERVGPGAIS